MISEAQQGLNFDTKPTQAEKILSWLKTGRDITPLQCIEMFGCLTLSQRVGDLKKLGNDIQSEMTTLPNGKHVKRYWLEK